MSIAETILPEYDQEMANTRRLMERVPQDRAEWTPHPKSFPLGGLTMHLANLPSWTTITLGRDELDLNPVGGSEFPRPAFVTVAAALETFDANVRAGREAISVASDGDFLKPWTLKSAGRELMTLPKVVVLRSFVLNHMIHHRGQLTVYLRMNDVPLPSTYGPTADDSGGF